MRVFTPRSTPQTAAEVIRQMIRVLARCTVASTYTASDIGRRYLTAMGSQRAPDRRDPWYVKAMDFRMDNARLERRLRLAASVLTNLAARDDLQSATFDFSGARLVGPAYILQWKARPNVSRPSSATNPQTMVGVTDLRRRRNG